MPALDQESQAPCYILSYSHKKIKIKRGERAIRKYVSVPLSSFQVTG